jgi:RimJ/RimL family protein N-acetyltransferase
MAARPPDVIAAPPVTLRRFHPEYVPAMVEAVNQSLEHLRPWMAWAQAPMDEAQQEKVVAESEQHFEEGSEYGYVMFNADGEIVGSCGLHRRGAPDTLEIGYWVHADHINQGIATAAAGALTDTALSLGGITTVEIHCDARNAASAAVPAKLGYQLVGVFEDPERGEGQQEMVWAFTPGSGGAGRR